MDTAYYAVSGDTIHYELLVQNQGSGIAYDVIVNDLLPDSVTLLDYDRIPESMQSDSISWSIDKIKPDSSIRISYRVQLRPMMPMGITVLTNEAIITCDRDSILTDNQDQATFNAIGLPDFNVTCTEPEAYLSPGYPSQLSALVRNIGNTNANQMFRVGFYLETINSDPIGIDTVVSLAAGDSQTVTCIWDEPNTGAYRLLVMADMDDAVPELIETNNLDTCNVDVGIDTIIVQVSSVSYTDQLKGVQGLFPGPIISEINIIDQNFNPIHDLANVNQWLGVADNCDLGVPVGNVWKNIDEYHRYNAAYPPDSDVQSGIQVIEVVDPVLSVTLVMDFTMTLQEMGWEIRNALESVVGCIESSYQGAVVGIQDGVNILQHFTTDGAQIKNAMAQSFANQSGMVYDGLYRGIELAGSRTGRNVVLAVVGEVNTSSKHTLNDVIIKAQTSGIPLYILGFKNHVESESLTQLCRESGGHYFDISDISGFEEGLRISQSMMENYYGLIHTSSDTIQNNTWRTLDVTISAFQKEGRDVGYYRAPFGVVDLSIEKTGVGDSSVVAFGDTTWWVHPGDSISYTIRVQNRGHWDVENATVQDILPDYLIPRSLCGDTLLWQIPTLKINETTMFTYQCRVDTLMPPWHAALVNQANIILESDDVEENNHFQDTVWATSMIFPDPEIVVSPEWIKPKDSIQVDVMSHVFVEEWDLNIFFENDEWIATYADDFIESTELTPDVMVPVVPKFGNTRKRTVNINEQVGVILETKDIWHVVKHDTAYFNIAVPDLSIDKQGIGDSLSVVNGDSVWYAQAGDSIWFTITVENIGYWDVEDITVEDILPDYLIPHSVCGDTLQWSVSTLQPGEKLNFSYQCRVDTVMPPWQVPLVNHAMLSCDQDTIDRNNVVQDTVWVVGLITPYPQVRVSPSVILPKDSVEVEVMSPIEVESWDLKILFQNGELITSYADGFIQSTELYPNVWETVTPKFDDTKMRTLEENEQVGVILETEDMWGVVKADTAYFRIRSYNDFVLDDNVFKPGEGEDLGIRFRLSSNRRADINIFDIAGHFVKNVESRFYEAGWNIVYWDGRNERGNSVGSGLYIVMISSGDMHEAKKVILIR